MKLSLVQILVEVAIIQVRILNTEAEKGFMRTAFDHESVDPKEKINLVKEIHAAMYDFPVSKGKKVNIPFTRTRIYYLRWRNWNQRRQ